MSFVRVVASRLLQKLRYGTTHLTFAATARSGALGRIAAKLGLQFDEVGEDVGLAPQLVGGP
jgi:hypothetical protein